MPGSAAAANPYDHDEERPEWPPRGGTKLAIYLPGSFDEHSTEVVGLDGTTLVTAAPSGTGPDVETGIEVKLLFPGKHWSWGYDGVLLAVERYPSALWHTRLTRGPVAVERRESLRLPQHRIVVLRPPGRMIPAHMLDRSATGMRGVAGRGVDLATDDIVEVEVDADTGDVISGARVMWRRLSPRGLEFGLYFGG